MENFQLLAATIIGIVLLLLLVTRFKINAFISLLIASIVVGLGAGMPAVDVLNSMQEGMAGTLGFVATVVGLGAIFGQILEHSGGAESVARTLIRKFGRDKAPWSMVITGFVVAIPVFLDVGFIILVPLIYALSRDTGKSLLYYGIPLLAGLAVTHAFIPPTPGPIAVADILGADLGWVILLGFIVGIPTAIIAGPIFGKYIGNKIHISVPDYVDMEENETKEDTELPPFTLLILIISVPLFLILGNTITQALIDQGVTEPQFWTEFLIFIGHPFSALTIAVLIAMYWLGVRRGTSRDQLSKLSMEAMKPAGVIILITGAGGVFKQVLVNSGVGDMLASGMADLGLPLIVLAWLIAAAVRVTQGSATVAMITAAGILAPIMVSFDISDPQKALIVLAIAAGSTTLSHVNDSGFWLVSRYFGMSEKDTLRSWTMMETIISVVGFALAFGLSFFV
ncbi:GntP family permease [Rhodohalobacter sp. 614A]|uniref:GntP family permease n=1 Tax=Rhodohalobacter sp. 614A TaxID=2908649 RepID=UPI001F29CEDE|nr:gluconate:H+ symporter [Rhodohalobacter sp. 614A]